MPQYGDEAFIYEMAQRKSQTPEVEIVNDINDGYIVINDERIPFSEREIIKKRLYMTIPSAFALMSTELAKFKYPDTNRPNIIFTNEEGSININFSLTKDKLENEWVEEARDFLQEVIIKMNPSCEIISSGIIDGETRIGYFDFVSPTIDGEVYNLMFLFALDGQFVLGTFNCTKADMNDWVEIAGQMVRSMRVIGGRRV